MRRLALITVFLALMSALLIAGLNTVKPMPAGNTLEANAQQPPTGRVADGFSLRMSPRLSRRPDGSPTSSKNTDIAASDSPLWQRIDPWLATLLLCASLLGMGFVRFWRAPDDAVTAPANRHAPIIESPAVEAATPVSDPAVDQVNAAAMRSLRERLAAVEDELHSTRTARDELAQQLQAVESDLGQAQENAIALEARAQERDGSNARAADLEQSLQEAVRRADQLADDVSRLDEEGIEQRVINVAFEKALLHADAKLVDTERTLDSSQQTAVDLTEQLHGSDERLKTLQQDNEAHVASIVRDAERERAALSEKGREQLDAQQTESGQHTARLQTERDELSASLSTARANLSERDATLESMRADLEQHIAQVASLGDVRDKLAAWQPTVDTLQADLRGKDSQVDTLRAELDDTTRQLIDARALADQVNPLRNKLDEQTALARILKDGADSMRLYKNAADSRGFQIDNLNKELQAQTTMTREAEAANEAARQDIAGLHRELSDRDVAISGIEVVANERTDRVEQLEKALADESQSLNELKTQLAHQREQRTELEDQFNELEALTRDVGAVLEAPIEPAPESIDVDTGALHQTARDSVQRVRERLAIVQDLERALELDLDDANTCLRMTESESIRVNDALNALLPKLASAQTERDRALAQNAELEQQIARFGESQQDRQQLESHGAELQTQLDEWNEREQEVVARIDGLAGERATLAATLSATRVAHDEAAAEAQRETVQRIALQHDIERGRDDISALREELANAQSTQETVHDLNEQLATATTSLATAESELAERDAQWNDVETHLETRLAESEQALANARAQYVAKAAEVDEIIRGAQEKRNVLNRELRDAQEKMSASDHAHSHEQQSTQRREEELATANLALRDALKAVRAQTDTQIQRLRSDLEGAEQTARALTVKLETSSRTQTTYANAVAQLKLQLGKAGAQIKTLKDAVTTLEQKRAEPRPTVAENPVSVPVLRRKVSAPPVLTRAVTGKDDDDV